MPAEPWLDKSPCNKLQNRLLVTAVEQMAKHMHPACLRKDSNTVTSGMQDPEMYTFVPWMQLFCSADKRFATNRHLQPTTHMLQQKRWEHRAAAQVLGTPAAGSAAMPQPAECRSKTDPVQKSWAIDLAKAGFHCCCCCQFSPVGAAVLLEGEPKLHACNPDTLPNDRRL